jgi:site-specific recombinase XerD
MPALVKFPGNGLRVIWYGSPTILADHGSGGRQYGTPTKTAKRPKPKTILRLPDLEQSKNAVLNSLAAPSSQVSYGHAIDEFIGWYCSEPVGVQCTVVLRYRFFLEQNNLAPSTINVRLAAVRRLAYEAADTGLLSPKLAAGIRRVKGAKRLGIRIGNWLTVDQSRTLLQALSFDTARGKRDRAILALLIGCGLRRAELVGLKSDDLQIREEHWVIADLIGKGKHIRTVPVPVWTKRAVDRWIEAARINSGRIFRRVNRFGQVWGEAITPKAIWHVVKDAAQTARIPNLAPHDLRRTCARLCHQAGGELEQIQFLLGHASVQTTERYLGCKQELRHAVNDNLGLEDV